MASKRVVSSLSSNYFALAARQMNITKTVLSLGKYRLNLPGGFAYGDYNGLAQIKPWSLIRVNETAQSAIFFPSANGTTSLDAHLLCKDYFLFFFASTMEVKKETYDIDLTKAPITLDVELEGIGNTSIQMKTSGFIDTVQDPLFIGRVKIVYVCNKTMQPKSPPEWWFEKYLPEVAADGKPMDRIDPSNKADGWIKERTLTVPPSDMDGYLHTNWTNYAKYCNDAFIDHHLTTTSNEYDHRDIFRQLKNLTIIIKKETVIGDSLVTHMFPHKSNPDACYFSIQKDKSTCCECFLEYYPL